MNGDASSIVVPLLHLLIPDLRNTHTTQLLRNRNAISAKIEVFVFLHPFVYMRSNEPETLEACFLRSQ